MADPNSLDPGTSNNDQNHNDANNEMNNGYRNGASYIDMFKEICGVDDDEIATQLLRESGGNLEAAIHQFFYTNENQNGPEMIENEDNEQQLRQRRVADEVPMQPNNNAINQLIPQRAPMTWGQWFRALVFLPLRFFYSTFTECLTFFYNLINGPPHQRNIVDRNRRAIQQNQQQNLIQDRLLMRDQQNEYNRALAIDRQKALERKQQEQLKLEEEKRAKAEMETLMQRINRIQQKRDEIAKSIADQVEPEMSEEGVVRIRVSFPNGVKMEKRFRITDSLERLFDAVFVHPQCPDDFSLLTIHPSTLLNCAPDWYSREFEHVKIEMNGSVKTFADHGLLNSAVIIVQDNDA